MTGYAPAVADPSDEARFLTAEQVARRLGVSRTTAHRIMREIGRVRTGRVVRVSREAFEGWLSEHTERPRAKRRGPAAGRDDRQLGLFRR